MENGSNTTTTSDEKVSELVDGTPVCLGDRLFWWEDYREKWGGGKLLRNAQGQVRIRGQNWSFHDLEWAVAEGRIKEEHLFNLTRQNFFKLHEIEYIY